METFAVAPIYNHMNNNYYIYQLIDTKTMDVFYVGKGSRSRMYQHKRDAGNPNYNHRSVHRKIQKILREGYDIKYDRIFCESEQQAFDREVELIRTIGRKDLGRGPLCNLTDGGEGTANLTPEGVSRRTQKHIGSKRSAKSKKIMSEVQRQKADERRKKYDGVACSPETRKRMSKLRKGKKWSDNARKVKRNKPTAKPVQVHEKDTGNYVGTYESISMCARLLGCDGTVIWKICSQRNQSKAPNGKTYPLKSHKGYVFKYIN